MASNRTHQQNLISGSVSHPGVFVAVCSSGPLIVHLEVGVVFTKF